MSSSPIGPLPAAPATGSPADEPVTTEGTIVPSQLIGSFRDRVNPLVRAANVLHKNFVGECGQKYDTLAEITRLSTATGHLAANFEQTLLDMMQTRKNLRRADRVQPAGEQAKKLRTELFNQMKILGDRFREISGLSAQIKEPKNRFGIGTPADIVKDLLQMTSDGTFAEFEIRYTEDPNGAKPKKTLGEIRKEKKTATIPMWLVATTQRCILTDLNAPPRQWDLGQFEIRLRVAKVVGQAYDWLNGGNLQCHALTPFPHKSKRECTHPNISSNRLCLGEGKIAIAASLNTGQLLSFFENVNNVIMTYGSDNPHARLEDWMSVYNCRDCNLLFDDRAIHNNTAGRCNDCNSAICGGCRCKCATCQKTNVCSTCRKKCDFCDTVSCRSCDTTCVSCTKHFCLNCDKVAPYPDVPKDFVIPAKYAKPPGHLCPVCNKQLEDLITAHVTQQNQPSDIASPQGSETPAAAGSNGPRAARPASDTGPRGASAAKPKRRAGTSSDAQTAEAPAADQTGAAETPAPPATPTDGPVSGTGGGGTETRPGLFAPPGNWDDE